jgi:hypothetical protein
VTNEIVRWHRPPETPPFSALRIHEGVVLIEVHDRAGNRLQETDVFRPENLAAIDKRHVIAVASDFGPEVRSDECRAAEPARPVGPEAPYSGVQEIRSGLEELDIMTEPLKGVEAMK